MEPWEPLKIFANSKALRSLTPDRQNHRGGAIDRVYIDRFIRKNLQSAGGRILECGGERYKKFIVPRQCLSYDMVDIEPLKKGITLTADLQKMDSVKRNHFDVVICTQVLQYVASPTDALGELHRILRVGGMLLLSVPFIERDYSDLSDRWRFSKRCVRDLLKAFRRVEIMSGGNLTSSICYLVGLGQHDVSPHDLESRDPDLYQVVMARAIK
jgi:SAM-dependent methyltransferase